MHRIPAILFSILLYPIIHGNITTAQSTSSNDILLSLLRGTWEYHTYEDKWTLEFQSDTRLILDNEPTNYYLVPNAIRINHDSEEIEYRYTLHNNFLTIEFSEGPTRKYEHKACGVEEQYVNGKFYTLVDSMSHHSISFKNNREFSLDSRMLDNSVFDSDIAHNGLYRIEGEKILLAYNDGTFDLAKIRYRDPDGTVNGIVFNGRFYDKESLNITVTRFPIILPCPPPPIPKPIPLPPIYIPSPPPVSMPIKNEAPLAQQTNTGRRDSGSMRGESPPSGIQPLERSGNRKP